MRFKTISMRKHQHLAKVVLHPPRESAELMMRDLGEAAEDISYDDDVWLVAITGEEGAFDLGVSLSTTQRQRATDALASLDRPLIVGFSGAVRDAGLELAPCADIRLAADSAQFGFSPGWLPAPGTVHRLMRLVGASRTLELLLTDTALSAEQARRWGLVTLTAPDDAIAAALDGLALELIQKAPIALRYIKEAVHMGLDMPVEQGLRLEADLSFLLHTTQDRREGIQAFQEKRRPVFAGC